MRHPLPQSVPNSSTATRFETDEWTVIELLIPYDRGDLLAAVHREGEVLSTHHDDHGVRVRARLADASAGRLSEFVVAPA